jgi:hypothetical protein
MISPVSQFIPNDFTVLPPQEDNEEGSAVQEFKVPVISDLDLKLTNFKTALESDIPHEIQDSINRLFIGIIENCGNLNVDEVIDYISKLVSLLGDKMLQQEYQKVFCLYLLSLTKIFTKVIMKRRSCGSNQAILDLYFLHKMKEVCKPYCSESHYDTWKENIMAAVVDQAKYFGCTTYDLVDFVTNFSMMDVLFTNDYIEMEKFKVELLEKTKVFSFEFLKRLFNYEISLTFFNQVIRDVLYSDITEEEIQLIGQFFTKVKLSISDTINILDQLDKKCKINQSGWNYLLKCLFNKIELSNKLLFNDVWKLITFVLDIGKKIEISEDLQDKFFKIFEKEILINKINGNIINSVLYSQSEQKQFIDYVYEGLMLLDNLQNETQKKSLACMLLGMVIIHIPLIKSDNAFKFIEKISSQCSPHNELDSLKLTLVVELISFCKSENPKGQFALIVKLSRLNLFKNSDLYFLLKNWNALYETFQHTNPELDPFVEAMGLILGVTKRELVFHLCALPVQILTLSEIKRRLFVETFEKEKPTARELALMRRICYFNRISIGEIIDFFQYLLSIYVIPEDLELLILRKILSTSIKTVNGEKLARTDKEGNPIHFHETNQSNDTDFIFYRNILRLLAFGQFCIDLKDFGKKNEQLIVNFLKQSFALDKVFDLNVLANEPKSLIIYNDFRKLTTRIIELYGINDRTIESTILKHWIFACNKLYGNFRKTARGLAQQLSKGEPKLSPSLSKIYFAVKQTLLLMVGAASSSRGAPLSDRKEIQALNRPLLVDLLPGEPILKIVKGEFFLDSQPSD